MSTKNKASDWIELGVIRSAMDTQRTPTVVRVSKSRRTRELSYELGILVEGKVKIIRHWSESRVYNMALLVKAITALSLSTNLTGMDLSPQAFESLIDRQNVLFLVHDRLTARQQRASDQQKHFGASIGDQLRQKGQKV